MNQADLAKLIADQISASIPTIAAQLKADVADQGSGGGSGVNSKSLVDQVRVHL
jgi:hypothetical protein